MPDKVFIYDTTLRDGSQAEGVSFSKADKIKIAEALDRFGVSYVEGGWPGSNPKDIEFFEAVKGRRFANAKMSAFGSTRRASVPADEDDNLRKLLEAETPAVAIFGKSWLLHVAEVLKVSPDDNLRMVADSVAFLRSHGREVIFDAEHFFDGHADNPAYALAVLEAAASAGASAVVLCDTNGGRCPWEAAAASRQALARLSGRAVLGIHAHNDTGMAVANSLEAVRAGARHVQGTFNGFGERCGNANLCAIIPLLQLRMGFDAVPPSSLPKLREAANLVCDLANLPMDTRQPFVGDSAFAHKGGVHVNAVEKVARSYEHIPPESVGNRRRILVSELSGRSNILLKLAEHHPDKLSQDEVRDVLAVLKEYENRGYEFEAADASFQLLARKVTKSHEPYFNLDGFRVIVEKRGHSEPCVAEATVKVDVGGEHELTASEGDGPVNALDRALRKALVRFYPEIQKVALDDFKVRIIEGEGGTSARIRVLIESTDGDSRWGTVGVSENIIEASWEALADSVEYYLHRKGVSRRRGGST